MRRREYQNGWMEYSNAQSDSDDEEEDGDMTGDGDDDGNRGYIDDTSTDEEMVDAIPFQKQ
jgi:hypothetical protein